MGVGELLLEQTVQLQSESRPWEGERVLPRASSRRVALGSPSAESGEVTHSLGRGLEGTSETGLLRSPSQKTTASVTFLQFLQQTFTKCLP